jgi:hypothetical protein
MTTTTITRTALAIAIVATPLSAQISTRRPDHGRDRTTTTTSNGTVLGSVLGGSTRTTDRIPPGQLPPRGMCRVWIDGVPPGQQPAVTDCATAQRQALGRANAHVIYGDQQSFPGKGKGKFKNKSTDRTSTARSCSVWDVVVVGGQQVPVCRDRTQQGRVIDRRSRQGDDDNEIDDDNDDRDEHHDEHRVKAGKGSESSKVRGKSKRGKGHGDD